MNRFFLSIITPVKNAAATIHGCTQSLIGQSSREFEWIVVDGGSTDATRQKIGVPDGLDFHFLEMPGSGVYAAINEGVRKARGTHMLVLNGDDRLFSGETVGSVGKSVDFQNTIFFSHFYGGRESWKNRVARKLPWPILQMPYPHGSWVVPLALQRELGDYDETLVLCADLDMYFRIRRKGNWRRTREPIVRIAPGGISETRQAVANREFLNVSIRHGTPRWLAKTAFWMRKQAHQK